MSINANNRTNNGELILPGLRAFMGDWVYYTSFMKMRDVAVRINMAEEIHESQSLKDLIQREVHQSKHSAEIKTYLLTQKQHFFNSLVVGVYGDTPKWYELDVQGNRFLNEEDLPDYIDGAMGLLIFGGSERLFAIDGQHRVVAIRKALQENDDLGDEEVSVIFVAHRNTSEGLERTRRLFTTLNRYAKPVQISEIIALDEDDVVAIITRRLMDEHPLFKDKVSLAKMRSISMADKQSFTAIFSLYDALDTYLESSKRGWKDFKRQRPEDDLIEAYYQKSVQFWDDLMKYFEPLQAVAQSQPSDKVAEQYRHNRGGHLLFRPIGLKVMVKAIKYLIDKKRQKSEIVADSERSDIIRRMTTINMNLADQPWVGLLWDDTNCRMITDHKNQKVAERLLIYAVADDLSSLPVSVDELKRAYAGLLNRSVDEVVLPDRKEVNYGD